MARALLLGLLLSGCVVIGPVTPSAPEDHEVAPPPLDALDRLVHDETNRARRRRDRGAVAWSDTLAQIARLHSADMARRAYFDHVSPEGRTPHDRGNTRGVECRKPIDAQHVRVGISENLYRTTRYERVVTRRLGDSVTRRVDWLTADEIADASVESWLHSPGHRRILLDPTVGAVGIGVALGPRDLVYITQVFC